MEHDHQCDTCGHRWSCASETCLPAPYDPDVPELGGLVFDKDCGRCRPLAIHEVHSFEMVVLPAPRRKDESSNGERTLKHDGCPRLYAGRGGRRHRSATADPSQAFAADAGVGKGSRDYRGERGGAGRGVEDSSGADAPSPFGLAVPPLRQAHLPLHARRRAAWSVPLRPAAHRPEAQRPRQHGLFIGLSGQAIAALVLPPGASERSASSTWQLEPRRTRWRPPRALQTRAASLALWRGRKSGRNVRRRPRPA